MRKKIIFLCLFLVLCLFFGKALYADQSISVTGSINPQPSDFQISVTANHADYFHQNDTVLYTITYGSRLFHPENIILEAQWDEGTLADQTTPSVDMINYIPGSATDAYASTSATVDLVNKTIRWSIPTFPANTINQTVQFAVKLSDTYQGSTLVRFPLAVRLSATNFTTPDQNLILNYLFDSSHVTSQPQYLPTPTPTPVPTPLTFTSISFSGISANSLTVDAITNMPTKLNILYGLSPDALTSIATDTTQTYQHIITIPKLTPNTKYYVQFVATTATGKTVTSDRYQFTTGRNGIEPQIDQQSITFVSADMVLFAPKPNLDPTKPALKPILVLPQDTAYNFRFQVDKPDTVKKVQAILRNKYVLGITSADAAEPNTLVTDLIETQLGLFEGRLESPSLPGAYQEFIRIYDTNGNITEHAVADVHVSAPLQVTNQQTQQPIEAAQVYLYYFNVLRKQFQPLPPQLFPVKNPSYTNVNGQLVLPLPQGQYKATITAIGYKPQNITFSLDGTHEYPSIHLVPESFNILTVGKYYFTIVQDLLSATKTYMQGISYSVRFFDLNAVIASALLVLITLFAFSRRIHIPLRSIPFYVYHVSTTAKMAENMIKGRIVDRETGNAIASAHIYLINHTKGYIVTHTLSNKTGEFLFHTVPQHQYDMQIMASGFEPTIQEATELTSQQNYNISLERRPLRPSIAEHIGVFTEKVFALAFEALLLLSFVFELALGFSLGFEKTVVFFVFSGINLFLWLLHMTHLHTQKEVF